jgi:hypothetical protein
MYRGYVKEPEQDMLSFFAWRLGKVAWPTQQPQAHDFVGLGSRSLAGAATAYQGYIQTNLMCKFRFRTMDM